MKLDNEVVDFEKSIGPWLGKTVKIIEYHIQEEFKKQKIDLTKEQMIVLKKLQDRNGLNQNELAYLTLRNKSSLTRLLTKMENKKYIIRKQSETDKRINNVFLTDLGSKTYKKTRPVIKDLIKIMEQNISMVEKDQTIKVLKKIQLNFSTTVESF
jgi:DNA-binding MarR family transcriptional regulator